MDQIYLNNLLLPIQNLLKIKVEALKSILDSGDNNDIKAKTDELTQEMYKLSSKLYENTAQQPGASQESKKDDDVVDADYEVVDDDENK